METPILCSMGGGFSSTAWLPRVLLETYPKEQIHFVTAVLPNEHPSMWKLYDAVTRRLDIKVTYIAYDKLADNKYQIVTPENRDNTIRLWTPFDIFDDVKVLGNSRFDHCSRILKRETIFNYVKDNYPEKNVKLAVGIHKEEIDRMLAIYENWKAKGYEVLFPLIDLEKPSKEEQSRLLLEWYDSVLDLYELGFEHNNCHGACIKAGQRQWALLWYYYPNVYRTWEIREAQWREKNGEYSILKKRMDGKTVYLTLKEFRENYLEPALSNPQEGFLARYIESLPGLPGCYTCSAI